MPREITKIGLAVIDDNRLLLVRKRGSGIYILPGGKPEQGENDVQALVREVQEELGCRIAPEDLIFLGSFSDQAAEWPEVRVTVRLYTGTLIGNPSPRAEIDQLLWLNPQGQQPPNLAPSLRNSILPFLSCKQGTGLDRATNGSAASFSTPLSGIL
jgi:8-oxo-dGTP diphosphatase